MRALAVIALLCLAMSPLACGGSESATDDTTAVTSQGEQAKPEMAPAKKPVAAKVEVPKVGSYPHEGPFAAISGGKGNEKPRIDLTGVPAPRNPLVRDLEKGSGPAARLGDEVTIYYAGAPFKIGKVQFYGWPPAPPTSFELGSGTTPWLWEVGIEGLRAGGIREVVAPSRMFGGTGAADYVIALMRVNPAS